MTINLTAALALGLFRVFLIGLGVLLSGIARVCDTVDPIRVNIFLRPPTFNRTNMILILIVLLDLLALLFTTLKLTGVVAWSWWWVVAPFWIPPAAVGAVLLSVGVYGCIRGCLRNRRGK